MLNNAVVLKTTRWSGFFKSMSASRPRRSCHERCSADFGVSRTGRKNVNPATISHVTAPGYPASDDGAAFNRLTSRHPIIQPIVAMARRGPNSFLASSNRARTMVEEMLHIGAEQSE